MERKNILFISSWFPNKLQPNNGNFVQRHAEAVALQHHVEILHAIGNPDQKEKFVFDDQIINGIRTLIVYYKNSGFSFVNFRRRMKAYQKGYQRLNKPDLIHANVLHNSMLFVVWLKKKHQIPFVITEHWTALQKDNHQKTPHKILKIAKYIGNQAAYLLPVSKNLQESLKELGIKTPQKVISNVVDTEIFTISDEERKIPKFLHISSLVARKKADRIVAVSKKLHDLGYHFKLEIGGDGDFKSIQTQIDHLSANDYISTFGSLSYEEVSEKMKNTDCFILFSENETQGCVILESFSCGVPVISTKVGGVPEFVQPNFGILIDKNNENQLLEAMKNVLDKKISFEKPQVLRNYVIENFSKKAISQQFSDLYNEVL